MFISRYEHVHMNRPRASDGTCRRHWPIPSSGYADVSATGIIGTTVGATPGADAGFSHTRPCKAIALKLSASPNGVFYPRAHFFVSPRDKSAEAASITHVHTSCQRHEASAYTHIFFFFQKQSIQQQKTENKLGGSCFRSRVVITRPTAPQAVAAP